MKAKPIAMWAVTKPWKGGRVIVPYSVRRVRRDSIGMLYDSQDWPSLRRQGYRCERVTVAVK